MPLQQTSGNATTDAYGGGVAAVPNYIEDVFSTYLYTGNSSTQTITNGIDLAGKGGLVWIKNRTGAISHALIDTARGGSQVLSSDTTSAQANYSPQGISAFNSSGFTVNGAATTINSSSYTYASWTFRKQPKFFDVVTYTGNGSGNRIITSSLGSPIGCVFIKRTDSTSNWATAHRKDGSAVATGLSLNTTAAALYPNSTNDTFDATGGFNAGYIVDSTGDGVNVNGASYVAYLFAHNAGGFGLTGTDNVISCGSFTTDGSGNATVDLGYEPQWVLIKYTTNDSWRVFDNMRGMSQTNWAELYPNTSDAEVNRTNQTNLFVRPNATGFTTTWSPQAGNTAIYIAIRRGPMKVPTSGTSVFTPVLRTTGNPNFVAGFPIDMSIYAYRPGATGTPLTISRLTNKILVTNEASAEVANDPSLNYDQQLGYGSGQSTNSNVLSWMWRRAPSFFDVVCFTYANTTNERITHNLGVAPELIIVKSRSAVSSWACYISTSALASGGIDKYIYLNQGNSLNTNTNTWGTSDPTATTFGMSPNLFFSAGQTLVAYLFATCAGVSKVGSYTGTGSTQTIACGFTGGARFVLIKRTDTDGFGWSVFDTARGMVSGTDPYLFLNSTAAETNANNVYTTTGGFQLVSSAGITNASGGTYIFLAIA